MPISNYGLNHSSSQFQCSPNLIRVCNCDQMDIQGCTLLATIATHNQKIKQELAIFTLKLSQIFFRKKNVQSLRLLGG